MIGVTTLVLGLVGGAFFPVSVLPGWLQPIAEVVPTRFAFDGARAALFVGDGWLGDTAALLVFSALASPAALYSFRGALLYAKNKGSLATY